MFSKLGVSLPEKPITPKKIGEDIKGPHRQFWKEALFILYDKNKKSTFSQIP